MSTNCRATHLSPFSGVDVLDLLDTKEIMLEVLVITAQRALEC